MYSAGPDGHENDRTGSRTGIPAGPYMAGALMPAPVRENMSFVQDRPSTSEGHVLKEKKAGTGPGRSGPGTGRHPVDAGGGNTVNAQKSARKGHQELAAPGDPGRSSPLVPHLAGLPCQFRAEIQGHSIILRSIMQVFKIVEPRGYINGFGGRRGRLRARIRAGTCRHLPGNKKRGTAGKNRVITGPDSSGSNGGAAKTPVQEFSG